MSYPAGDYQPSGLPPPSYAKPHGKLPARTFGASSTRETLRSERERAQREAQSQGAGGSSNPLSTLTDEQREEINEAVRTPFPLPERAFFG